MPDDVSAAPGAEEKVTRETQAELEDDAPVLEGTSTTRRPDALSLDYLRAFARGPVALQDASEGVFGYAWYIRVDNSVGEVYVARENAAGDGWQAESTLFTFDEAVAPIDEVDLAFNQNGDPVVVAERATGSGGAPELWIRYFDPVANATTFTSFGAGRNPRAIIDIPRDPPQSDVLIFYVSDPTDAIVYRVQADRYDTEYTTSVTGVSETRLQELARNVQNRLQIAYSERDATAGTYQLKHLVSALYPFIAATEGFEVALQPMSAAIREVVIEAHDQPREGVSPLVEPMSVEIESIIRWVLTEGEDPASVDPEALGFTQDEGLQAAHEPLSALVNEVILEAFDQPIEGVQATHEPMTAVVSVEVIEAFNQPAEGIQAAHEPMSAVVGNPLDRALALYDAHDLALNDGDAVASWPDARGTRDLSAPAGDEPVYRASGLNAEPAVDFGGATTDHLAYRTEDALTDLFDAGASATIFVVILPGSTAVFDTFVGFGNSANSDQLIEIRQTDTDTWQWLKKDGGSSSDVDGFAGGTVSLDPHVLGWRLDGTNDELREDDVQVATGAIDRSTLDCDNFVLGYLDRAGSVTHPFDGLLGAVAVWDHYLTGREMSQAYDEMADRFNL